MISDEGGKLLDARVATVTAGIVSLKIRNTCAVCGKSLGTMVSQHAIQKRRHRDRRSSLTSSETVKYVLNMSCAVGVMAPIRPSSIWISRAS